MKKALIITAFLIFGLNSVSAYNYALALKGGLSYTWVDLESLQDSEDEDSEDSFTGIGFNTHFNYVWSRWEFGLSSYIYWGDVDGMRFRAQGETISGDGSFRHVSFGPIIRYLFKGQSYKNWFPYFGLGPSWSLQTIKIDEPNTAGSFNKNQKITYLSKGGFLIIGIEEDMRFKEMHPVYLEFLYSYKDSKEVSIVDSSDPTQTSILSTDEANQDLSGHFFMISLGITIF